MCRPDVKSFKEGIVKGRVFRYNKDAGWFLVSQPHPFSFLSVPISEAFQAGFHPVFTAVSLRMDHLLHNILEK